MRPYSVQCKELHRMSVPNNNHWPSIKKLQQNNINFPYSQYPFPNQKVQANLLSTIVQCNINDKRLENIINLKCQNIISLRKIVKMKIKDKKYLQNIVKQKTKCMVSTYEFFYEKVQYSLGYIFQQKQKGIDFQKNNFKLDRAQIKKTLANTIAKLFKQGIIKFLQFSHIGINQNGVLKIYVAPNVLFDEGQYNPKTKILVIKYLNNVLKQIDSKFPKSLKTKNSVETLKSHEISIQNDIIANEQSFMMDQDNDEKKKKTYQYLRDKNVGILLQNVQKSFNDQQQNFIGSSGSTNLQHLKLQSQMKKRLQNHKLVQKAQQNINNQKRSRVFTKLEQNKKINEISFQLAEIRKKIRQKAEQKRQKNLYTTAGYKTMATQAKKIQNELQKCFQKVQKFDNNNKNKINLQLPPKQNQEKKKKRKQSQSSINFYQGPVPNQKNINCINIYHHQNNYHQSYNPFGDDAMSVDTYEMQIGDDYQMPKMNSFGDRRKTLLPNATREYLKNKAKPSPKQTQKTRFYQSAGGKRFNHIVNLLKPQFQPKKSNIFQEPQIQNQQQSKKSVSLRKSKVQDKQQIQKRRQAKIKLSSSQNNLENQIKGIKTLQQFKNQLKSIMKNNSFSRQKMKTDDQKLITQQKRNKFSNPQTQSCILGQKQQKHKSYEKYDQVLKYKQSLQQKVKKAMQRTKKAIDVLNKAKIRQDSPLRKREVLI